MGSSEGGSSLSSSLRSEKSLRRQKQWEVEHARARADRRRKQLAEAFRQEEKVMAHACRLVSYRALAVVTSLRPGNVGPITIDSILVGAGTDSSS